MSTKKNLITLLVLLITTTLMSYVHARNVNLGARSKRICIGKSKTLLNFSVQRQRMSVDGRTSGQSTWNHQGQFALLMVDVDRQKGLTAFCQRAGRETFSVNWKLAYSDPNNYSMRYTVNCVPCAKERIKLIKKKINDTVKILKDTPAGEYRDIMKRKIAQTLLDAKKELTKILKDKRTPTNLKKKIRKILGLISSLYELLMSDKEHSAEVKKLLYRLNLLLDQLASQLKLPALEVPIRIDGRVTDNMTPIEFEIN
jgi:hypothetical protein